MSEEHNRNNSLPDDLADDRSTDGTPSDEHSLLTAYALAELGDDKRAEMEARLRESAEERQAAEELTRLGKLLRKVVNESPLPECSVELREAVLAELAEPFAAGPPVSLPERFPRRRFWLPLSLAASLAVVCGALFGLTKAKHAEKKVAQRDGFSVSQATNDSDLADAIAEISENGVLKDARLPSVQSMGRTDRLVDEPADRRSTVLDAGFGGQVESKDPSTLPVSSAGVAGGLPPVALSASTALGQLRGNPGSTSTGGRGAEEVRQLQQQQMAAEGEARQRINAGLQIAARRSERLGSGGGMPARPPGGGANGDQGGNQQGMMVGGIMPRLWAGAGEPDAMHLGYISQLNTVGGGFGYQPNTESYPALIENPFRKATEHPLSTFSVDVDTASYTNVRRFLKSHALPPPDAVRIEELINYFHYSYPQPEGETPFSVTTDVADCPWNAEHRLLRVGLKGREVPANRRPASNLVFLLDVSGSMEAANKLPLVKEAMYLLTDKLTENDRVAIVVYAGNSGLVLPPTNGENKAAIRNAISQLVASGSTNGGQGLQMAYDTAQAQFIKGGTNRVILATDGDFNVGVVDQNDLVRLIEEKAKGGVYLSALGFGVGNLKDGTLEKLADKGNGNYAYIDTLGEARRVLVEQLSGTLVTIAKDVKLQIEFNPAQAAEYRLIGYEDRVMPHQDFHDDRKDAGELGAGHTVTALYEIVPAARAAGPGGEPLKYQRSEPLTAAAEKDELATIKLRYKPPEGQESRLIERVVTDQRPRQAEASRDLSFAAAVAAFGMLLRESPYRGTATYQSVLALAEQGLANDTNGYRSEFIQLVRQAQEITVGAGK